MLLHSQTTALLSPPLCHLLSSIIAPFHSIPLLYSFLPSSTPLFLSSSSLTPLSSSLPSSSSSLSLPSFQPLSLPPLLLPLLLPFLLPLPSIALPPSFPPSLLPSLLPSLPPSPLYPLRKLKVSPSNAFGADVRSLRPTGFTFVLLPAEGPEPSTQPLLPMIQKGERGRVREGGRVREREGYVEGEREG